MRSSRRGLLAPTADEPHLLQEQVLRLPVEGLERAQEPRDPRGGALRAVVLLAKVRPPKDQTNYEGWLVARFGWRLYRTFFKTYTEKVWGVPVADMPADWRRSG